MFGDRNKKIVPAQHTDAFFESELSQKGFHDDQLSVRVKPGSNPEQVLGSLARSEGFSYDQALPKMNGSYLVHVDPSKLEDVQKTLRTNPEIESADLVEIRRIM